MSNVNINHLVAAVSETHPELTKTKIKSVVKGFVEALISNTVEHGNVHVSGLGRFKKVSRPERQGRNPRTGEALIISARDQVRFRPTAALKKLG